MGLTGPQGITGTQGITGLQGIQGIQGPAGQVGYCFLNNSSAAVIAVVLGGTYIPLPDNQSFGSGLCTINGSNTDITLSETGTYVISTNVIVTTDLLMSTQVLLNGIPLQPQFTPIVATDSYPLTVVINATAGDIVSLQAFGLLGAVTLIGGNGASMTILKVA